MALVGGRSRTEGSSYLQAGAPLPPSGPGSAGPCAQDPFSAPYRRDLPEDEPGWAPERLSSLQVGPAGGFGTAARTGGQRRLGKAGRALPGLLHARLLPAPAPPHCASVGEPETWGCSFPPRRLGGGVSAAGAMARLARLRTPWKERSFFPSGPWQQCRCRPRGPHSCVAV